jgi:hypothetical protein
LHESVTAAYVDTGCPPALFKLIATGSLAPAKVGWSLLAAGMSGKDEGSSGSRPDVVTRKKKVK